MEISNERLEQIAKLAVEILTFPPNHAQVAEMARELLALRKARVMPDGWVLVPVEPTTEMLEEIWLDSRFKEIAMRRRYEAMLRAVPLLPE